MKAPAKRSSAANRDGSATRGSVFGRRNAATRAFSLDPDGSGAPSCPHTPASRSSLRIALLVATAAFLLIPAASAWANGNVNVTVLGSGSGTVTSTSQQFFFGFPLGPAITTPGEINCNKAGGPICSAGFSAGFGSDVTVTLTATPDSGGGPFTGWVQNGATSSQRCTMPPGSPATCEVVINGFDPGPTSTVIAIFGDPPPPPVASTDPASDGASPHLMTLRGRVNPSGAPLSDCHFEYGETSEYGQRTACDQSPAALGLGSLDRAVSASTEPLEPGTLYHYRLFATGFGGASNGKDRTFVTPSAPADSCPNAAIRASQGVYGLALPDCMALEHVSPPRKFNQRARSPQISPDGHRVTFNSTSAIGDTGALINALGDPYLASRGGSGWQTEGTTPPGGIAAVGEVGFSSDFSRWAVVPAGTSDEVGQSSFRIWQGGVGGLAVPLSPLVAPLGTPLQGGYGPTRFQGASPDFSQVYFTTGDTSDVSKATSYLPGDPAPAGTSANGNLYIARLDSASQPSLTLLARDKDGRAWGANCGARLGGNAYTIGDGGLIATNGAKRSQGAISLDNSVVYFSARAAQPPTGDCANANKMRILKRTETPAGPEITQLIQSECVRVSPACDTTDGDDLFQGASVDQTRVYFTTTRQLADTDLDTGSATCSVNNAVAGCDLYLYDSTKPVGERLTQVSAGDSTNPTPGLGARVRNGIAAISRDGSHAYFVATGVLTTDPNPEGATAIAGQNNFYAWDANSEEIAFIGTVGNDGGFSGGDVGLWGHNFPETVVQAVPRNGQEVGGDGHTLVFPSTAQLTADDSDGSRRDLFRFDADADTLARVSKAGPGGADNGAFDTFQLFSASEDGGTIVFQTAEALLPGDVNGAEESYFLREDQLYRLPNAQSGSVSADGSTIAFQSVKRLLFSDSDTVEDIYVARVNGGYPPPPPGPACEGEACQGAPIAVSGRSAGSATFSGTGNLRAEGKPTGKRCPKGKRRLTRNGKTRCVPKKTKKQASGHKRKRAGNKQGGPK